MKLIINRIANICRAYLNQTMFGNSHFRNLQLAGVGNYLPESSSEKESESVFDNFLWFGAPKSKISPGRKREKHGRFIPDPVNWVKCPRCGESKIPLRMCTKNKEICAMREEDWIVFKKNNPNPLINAKPTREELERRS